MTAGYFIVFFILSHPFIYLGRFRPSLRDCSISVSVTKPDTYQGLTLFVHLAALEPGRTRNHSRIVVFVPVALGPLENIEISYCPDSGFV